MYIAPCISPYGPRPIGGMWYQVFAQSVTQETQVLLFFKISN